MIAFTRDFFILSPFQLDSSFSLALYFIVELQFSQLTQLLDDYGIPTHPPTPSLQKGYKVLEWGGIPFLQVR